MNLPDTSGSSPPIRIVVVDDHALFRRGVGQLLSMYPDIRVVADAPTRMSG